jgi:poly(hydroxyalkanoate) depolymerase family esterase
MASGMLRLLPALLVAFALTACGPDLGSASTDVRASTSEGLSQVSSFGSNPGNLSMFEYVPSRLPGSNVPVVVALHGCTQSAGDYQKAGWNGLADEVGFIVIYPQTTANNSCFAWWDSAQARRGVGQALSIKQMVDSVKAQYPVGPVYVTGLSAGGAMTSVMLAAYPDVFSAGAIMSGIAYRCADTQSDTYSCMFGSKSTTAAQWGDLVRGGAPTPSSYPRVAVWEGSSDGTVVPANADEIVAQWTNVHGLAQSATATETVGKASHATYADAAGVAQVESWRVSGMSHGTAVDPANGCGTAGAYILDVGLCSTRYSARFFGLTAALTTDAGTVTPDAGTTGHDAGTVTPDAGTSGHDAGTVTPDAGTSGHDAGTVTPDAGTSGHDAGTVTPDAGTSTPDAGTTCQEWHDNNYGHTLAGRAQLCQPVNGHACTVGHGDDLGLWNIFTTSWVKQTQPGAFVAGRCP